MRQIVLSPVLTHGDKPGHHGKGRNYTLVRITLNALILCPLKKNQEPVPVLFSKSDLNCEYIRYTELFCANHSVVSWISFFQSTRPPIEHFPGVRETQGKLSDSPVLALSTFYPTAALIT